MSPRRTWLLLAMIILAALAAILGNARLGRTRLAAVAARDDLHAGRAQLADLRRWRSGSANGSDGRPATPDTSHLTRLLRDAAEQTGAAEALVSIEPASAGSSGSAGSDFTQVPVFLRLESISMKVLTLFLHRLATLDLSSRTQSIELLAADSDGPAELWNADVTIVYINHSPRERQP